MSDPLPVDDDEADEYLSAEQVGVMFGTSRRWALEQAKAGRLPAIRLSKTVVRFRRSDVNAFIRDHIDYDRLAAAIEKAAAT